MLQDTATDLIDQVVSNPDSFYPDLNIKYWQELYRVPGTTQRTLERQVTLAMRDVNARLATWKAELIEAAVEAGDPVPTELPAEHATDYEEAIFAYATGLLIPLLPSLVMDERAREELEELYQTPGPFYDRAAARLGRITGDTAGRGRLKAEVI